MSVAHLLATDMPVAIFFVTPTLVPRILAGLVLTTPVYLHRALGGAAARMERQALGLIETVGLVGAIEAADAAAKSASVRLVKSEVTEASLVTIQIEGELGAVQAAVAAGVAACQRIGQVLTHTVIPRPDRDLGAVVDTPSHRWKGRVASSSASTSRSPDRSTPKRDAQPPPARPRGSQDYDAMTVAALRRLARRRGDLPISGREIAHADKELLIRLLREADI